MSSHVIHLKVTRPKDILNAIERRGLVGKSAGAFGFANIFLKLGWTMYWKKFGLSDVDK